LITKGYILAIAHGDIKSQTLYTRIHSSCVTSENMRSLDCDCVLQLEGAMKKIAEKKNGILFYLIQEGRGCGYVGKSRACMIV
jgi:3,4-dihydroxy 2-butanone 4-phosphate synthase/GTP cyclohydrolase II